jgi:hypothetical protein
MASARMHPPASNSAAAKGQSARAAAGHHRQAMPAATGMAPMLSVSHQRAARPSTLVGGRKEADDLTIFASAHIVKSVIGKRVLLAHPRCPSHIRRLLAPAIKGSSPMDMAVIELSRLQFALTAMYHFLFVPLTLGLSFMLVIMESIYVITKRPIWRIITRFWGKLSASISCWAWQRA